MFSQTSNEQPQICSGPVGSERQWALELGTPLGDDGAPAHGPECGHRASTRDKAQPGFGNRSECGACQHPAPSRKQSSSADRGKVGTEPGGKLTASFCRVEKSSSAFLCGTQDWTQVLSPPKVGEAEILSGHACRDMLTSRTFVDLTYHRQFGIKVPGVTVRAYTARGTLQASGQDIF